MGEKHVAVVGATGMVGREMVKVLEQRDFPVSRITLLASERSKGLQIKFRGDLIPVEVLNTNSFKGVDICLFSAGAGISREYAPIAVEEGAVVIDNSSAFRMEPEVPLVVPEVNGQEAFKNKGIIANPNCSTIQMVVVIAPLHRKAVIERIVVTTFQSVSGTGKKAVDELERQVKQIQSGEHATCEVYPHQIAFNVLPHIDVFLKNGYTKEEIKMVNETKKILGEPDLRITATTVRVPVFVGHSESVNVQFSKSITPEEAREILVEAPGVEVIDDPERNLYPLPIHCAGKDPCFVGRIREDPSAPNSLNLWIVADNLRKGAALNAVQIAEILCENKAI